MEIYRRMKDLRQSRCPNEIQLRLYESKSTEP